MLGERNGRLQYFVGGMGITTGFQYNCQVRTQFPGVPAAHRHYRKRVRVYGEDDRREVLLWVDYLGFSWWRFFC